MNSILALWRSMRWFLVALVLGILGATAAAIYYDTARHRETETARLQTIADLKTRQIADWLRERQGDVEFLQTSRAIAENFRKWRERGDNVARGQLFTRLHQFGTSKGFESVLLLDEQGRPLWDSAGEALTPDPTVRDLARQAVAAGGRARPCSTAGPTTACTSTSSPRSPCTASARGR
jgi:hypothetical protein